MNKNNIRLRSYETLLTNPYISANVISHVLHTSHKTAKDIFNYVKEKELEEAPIINDNPLNARPHRVCAKTFLDVMGLTYADIEQRYRAQIKLSGGLNETTQA